MVHFLWASEIQHTLFWIGNFSPRNNKDQIIFNHGGRRISFEEAYSLALLVSYNQIPIQLFSATLAEMRLNRTLMERSIPIPLFSATLAEMRLNRTLMEKYDVNGTLAEMRLNRTLMDCRGLPGRSSSKLNHTSQQRGRVQRWKKRQAKKATNRCRTGDKLRPWYPLYGYCGGCCAAAAPCSSLFDAVFKLSPTFTATLVLAGPRPTAE